MKIIDIDPLKKLSDTQLLDKIAEDMESLRYLQNTVKDEELDSNQTYRSLFIVINNMIREAKRRKIKLDSDGLTKRILKG